MKTELKSIELNRAYMVNGIVQVSLSIYWIWHFGRLMYLYNFTDILFFYMYPNWTLILFITMAILGTLIGLAVYLKKRKIKNGYIMLVGLFIIGLIIDIMVVS